MNSSLRPMADKPFDLVKLPHPSRVAWRSGGLGRTVYAANGFGSHEVAALNGMRQLDWEDHEPLRVQLVGLGRPDDFRCPLFGPARIWESATPFIVTRHAQETRPEERPARLSRPLRPTALRGPRPRRRMPTLAPAPAHPCGRRPARLYSPGAGGSHQSVPTAPVSSQPTQTRRRWSESCDGSVSLGVRPRGDGAVVSGPRFSFRPGPVPSRSSDCPAPFFLVAIPRTPKVLQSCSLGFRVAGL